MVHVNEKFEDTTNEHKVNNITVNLIPVKVAHFDVRVIIFSEQHSIFWGIFLVN